MQRRDFIKNCVLCASAASMYGGYKLYKNEDKHEDCYLKTVDIRLVEHCNLKCKYCNNFSCVAEEEYYDKSDYEKDIARLAKVTQSKVKIIKLLGGEPLLHPDIEGLFDITRKYFPNTSIILISNSVLINDKPESFWQCMSKNNIKFQPSIYPINLDWKSIFDKTQKYNIQVINVNGEEVTIENLEKNRVNIFIKFCLDLEGKQSAAQKCLYRKTCATYFHGLLYPCFLPSSMKHFNKKFNQNIPVTDKDCIDIYKTKNLNELLSFIEKPNPICKYCKQYQGEYKWETAKEHHIEEWVPLFDALNQC